MQLCRCRGTVTAACCCAPLLVPLFCLQPTHPPPPTPPLPPCSLCLSVNRRYIPYAVEDFRFWYYVINVLLVGLYFMQLLWMRSIARVLRWAPAVTVTVCLCGPPRRSVGGQGRQPGPEVQPVHALRECCGAF